MSLNQGISTRSSQKEKSSAKPASSADHATCNSPNYSEQRLLLQFSNLLDNKLQSLRESIVADFSDQLMVLGNQIDDLNERINLLESNSDRCNHSELQNEVLRCRRMNDIIITGIPSAASIDADIIFKKVAACLDIVPLPYSRAFRLRKSNDKVVSPVIVKLSCEAEKRAILNAVKKRKKPILLKELDCDFLSDAKVLINDSLLPGDLTIKREALRLRRESGVFYSVESRNGYVYIRHTKNDNPTRVKSLDQLRALLTINQGAVDKDVHT